MKDIISVAVVGLIVAIGKVLLGKDKLNPRILIGRGIIGGALGLLAYPALWIVSSWLPLNPALELQIIVGTAAALSAMGTEILEKAIEAIIFKFTGKDISDKDK